MEDFIFEKLDVWKRARSLVSDIYRLLDKFPSTEKYALCDQIRRASVSIVSNIAEGSGRASIKEKIHFLEIAYGSLLETYNQFIIALDLKYISEGQLIYLKPQFIEIAKMVSGWRRNLKNQPEQSRSSSLLTRPY